MSITAAQVKELRERTGVGMMECKKALVGADGNIETAIDLLRKSGAAKAAKKAGRTTAEGRIAVTADSNRAVLLEVNCETDFVAKDDSFGTFADAVAKIVHSNGPVSTEELQALDIGNGTTIEATRQELTQRLGENVTIRQFLSLDASGDNLGTYTHGDKIGVLVDLQGGDAGLAKDVAMHIAASRPSCVDSEDVPAEELDKEREILRAQAEDSGKPADIVEKMVAGRIKKYISEITLYGQPFVKDPDTTVGKLLEKSCAKVHSFMRLEVGEGIEKKSEDFASEVMSQVQQASQ